MHFVLPIIAYTKKKKEKFTDYIGITDLAINNLSEYISLKFL